MKFLNVFIHFMQEIYRPITKGIYNWLSTGRQTVVTLLLCLIFSENRML